MLDPKITNRRICLLQADVPLSRLMWWFDQLSSRVRQAIADSPFQLCIECIVGAYFGSEESALAKIHQMEEEARRALKEERQ